MRDFRFGAAALLVGGFAATAAADNVYSNTIVGGWSFEAAPPFVLTFPDTPLPEFGGTLTITATGDLDALDEYFAVAIEGTDFGIFFDDMPLDGTEVIGLSRTQLGDWVEDGQVDVTISPSATVGNASVSLYLNYGSIPEPTTMAMLGLAITAMGMRRR
ncbi:MAG: PEP-CTERM sorting domain-containing protein [Phycisphaerae bacterium]